MKIETVDKWFSKFIRLRDSSPPYGNGNACIGECCTCGKHVLVWDHIVGFSALAHCGHFIGRYFQGTRFDEKNCHLQCKSCNTFAEGKQFEHSLFIDKTYGKGTAEKLLIKSKMLCKRNRYDLEVLGKHYREKAQALAKEKGVIIK